MSSVRKANPVGVLTSAQALSPAQRQHYTRLRSKGVEEEVARALAQALTKSRLTKAAGRTAPEGVRAACRRGLDIAGEHGGQGLTEGAKARARSMAAGNSVSDGQIKRMKSFFARHGAYEKQSSPPSPGYVSWMLWGGNAGRSWANSQADKLEKANKPLGAAFAHGKRLAREKGGGKKKERAAANAYLQRQGHAPMGKASADDQPPESQSSGHVGAAFQYARRLNAQRGGDKKAQRQLAEDYLVRRGHAPLKKGGPGAAARALSRRAQISAFYAKPGADAQARWDAVENDLLTDPAFAPDGVREAMAALNAETGAVTKAAFPKAFVAAAKEKLPPYFYDQVHATARSSAGGKVSGDRRRAARNDQASLDHLWEQANALLDELEKVRDAIEAHPLAQGEAEKSVPVASEIHVDAPLGSRASGRPGKKKVRGKRLAKRSPFTPDAALADVALAGPEQAAGERLADAARLVGGMDWERRVGAVDTEDARRRASRQLAQEPGYYDDKFMADPEVRWLRGLDVDIGSGQARRPGYLGLDLYPYDHGTAIYDVGLGLPFGDMAVRSVRLVNALQYMPDLAEDATPLLSEIQRALTYGGKLLYEGRGDLRSLADWSQLPGLVLVGHEDTQPLPGGEPTASDLHIQTFERVRTRLPRIYGADPTWAGIPEQHPDDLRYALAAMGGVAPAAEAMAGLLKSAEDQGPNELQVTAPIGTRDEWQRRITCVVYAPNERDLDGEYMEPADIERMAHDAYRLQIPIKVEHVGEPVGAHIVESFIAPADFVIAGPEGPQQITKGSWLVVIQFTDDDQWQKVLSGEYRGISVGGRALYEVR